MTIWRMRIASWVPMATHSLTICNTHCFSTATMVERTRLIIRFYVHFLSCLIYSPFFFIKVSCLGVFTFLTCCIVICHVCFVDSFKLPCVWFLLVDRTYCCSGLVRIVVVVFCVLLLVFFCVLLLVVFCLLLLVVLCVFLLIVRCVLLLIILCVLL